MEDCDICFQSKENSNFFIASICKHKLCINCFKLLQKNTCPFCRQLYTVSEIEFKNSKLQHQLKRHQNNNSTIFPNTNLPFINRRLIFDDIHYSRVRRNMIRKRRKNLTFEQVIERRIYIKKLIKQKWAHKNGRLLKHQIIIN